jgi:hypothetical protein
MDMTLTDFFYRLWILPGDWGVRIIQQTYPSVTPLPPSPIDSVGWIALAVFVSLIILSRVFARLGGVGYDS